MLPRSRPRGYLVVLMAICATILTIMYLRLAAGSREVDERAEQVGLRHAAYYAAESGLLQAEKTLDKFAGKRPNPGVHWYGDLPHSNARFKVEVQPGDDPKRFIMRSIGTADSASGRSVTVSLDAKAIQSQGQWHVHSRATSE